MVLELPINGSSSRPAAATLNLAESARGVLEITLPKKGRQRTAERVALAAMGDSTAAGDFYVRATPNHQRSFTRCAAHPAGHISCERIAAVPPPTQQHLCLFGHFPFSFGEFEASGNGVEWLGISSPSLHQWLLCPSLCLLLNFNWQIIR